VTQETAPPAAGGPADPLSVTLVSGEQMSVMSLAEARWFNQSRDTYLAQTRFSETTDLRDLDRLLSMELQVFRMSQWLSAGHDYDNFDIEEPALLRRNIREYSEQITRVKSSMGLTKSARDEAANSGDVSTYLTNLKARAKLFGIHRQTQLTRALTLMNELSAIVGGFDRADGEERQKLGFDNEAEIVDWIRTRMLPEYRELDEHFRANSQRYWIRNM
jgi:hypothetical protein